MKFVKQIRILVFIKLFCLIVLIFSSYYYNREHPRYMIELILYNVLKGQFPFILIALIQIWLIYKRQRSLLFGALIFDLFIVFLVWFSQEFINYIVLIVDLALIILFLSLNKRKINSSSNAPITTTFN